MRDLVFDDLLAVPFEWGGRFGKNKGLDCLGLAIEVRSRILPHAEALPEFDSIYRKFNRETIPTDEILVQATSSLRSRLVHLPTPGCIAVLEGTRGAALGTFIGDYGKTSDAIILFGSNEYPVIAPDWSLPNLIGYFEVN